jgi:hypothetical protein
MSNSIARVAAPCASMESMKNGFVADQTSAKKWNDQYFVGTVLSDELKRAAGDNEPEAIDYLFTLACEGGAIETGYRSKAAAAFLYQLYQQEKDKDSLLFQQLGKDSLKLFEIVSARNAFHDARVNEASIDKAGVETGFGDGHWIVPVEILTMAKHAANPESQLCNDIVDQLKVFDSMEEEGSHADDVDTSADAAERGGDNAETAYARALRNWPITTLIRKGFSAPSGSRENQAILAEIRQCAPSFYATLNAEVGDDAELFAPDRMISSAEIDVVSNALNLRQEKYRFHAARKIDDRTINGTAVDPQLHAVLKNQGQQGMFVPLLFREHWVLFGVQLNDVSKKAVVFSSVDGYLTNAELGYLDQLARYCGISKASTLILQQDLQHNLPNACGLLVTQAMQHVADPVNYDAVTALRKFIRVFSGRSDQAQIAFNRQGRFELYGELLDFYSTSEAADAADMPVRKEVTAMLMETRL